MSYQECLKLESEQFTPAVNAAADINAKVTALFPRQEGTGAVDQALELFNRMSSQLTESYRSLESRVNQLSGELSAESAQRQQELEEKERLAQRLTTVLNLLPAGVVVLDGHGLINQCNPAALALLGEPLEGQRWVDVIKRSFAPRLDDGHEVSLRDGRRVAIEIRSIENAPGQLILLTDLTETRALQQRVARSERLSSMGRMVASLAHQVRTPLSAAMLYGSQLSQPGLNETIRLHCADKLMSRLAHLEQQVRDMLIFARGETRLAERMLASDFFAGLQAAAEPLTRNGKATLMWLDDTAGEEILCNRDALIGACINLINNSLEASGDGARIEVTLSMPSCDEVMLTVADHGPGFTPEQREKMLEPFYTTKSQGTGLGLAVVQAVVKAHNGTFDLQSDGNGAQAYLTLPVQEPAQILI